MTTADTSPAPDASPAPEASPALDTPPAPPAPPAPAGWRPALAPAVSLRHDRVRDADLLVLPERVVVLRGSAARILRLCDGARDLDAIVAELTSRFPGAPVAEDVPAFLGRMRTEGWVR
ncbi:pyrroloquinoline quinone biosynthesis peptide chaperone PqqD [Streptomyces sp. NPDC020125]|uniref:pyrroloquinoline quinone biosynthesis peptide chaperone PqqD n=1 Tax=Streptomyces sp. NPDC020125 TaxID=3154593 RepID=UPI0033D43522